MEWLIEANRWFHMIVGFAGLAAWWVPIVTKKGGRRHQLFGKVFALSAYVIGTTALLSASMRIGDALWRGIDVTASPAAFGFLIFLAYLGVVTIGMTHFAVQSIRTRRDPEAMRTPFLRALHLAAPLGSVMVVAWALLQWSSVSIVLLLLSPLGFLMRAEQRAYLYQDPREKMGWWYAHMSGMLGAGIAFHTAFLVFGSRVVLDLSVLGPFNWVPWVLPALIGVVGGSRWERFYRRKFGDLPAEGEAAAV